MYLSTFPQKGVYLYLSTFVMESTCLVLVIKYIQSAPDRLWLPHTFTPTYAPAH